MNRKDMNTVGQAKWVATMSIFTALALIFSYIEAILPLSIAIPGVKLGIANIVIVLILYMIDFKSAIIINILRVIVMGFLFTGAFGIFFSSAGALLSLIIMFGMKKIGCFSILGVSMAGGVAHNIGQLFMAVYIMDTFKIFVYFPILLLSGLLTGFIIGMVAYYVLKRLPQGRF